MSEKRHRRQGDRLYAFPHPSRGADRCDRLKRGRGGQAAHLIAMAQDDAGAKEADPGRDCPKRRTGIGAAERQGDLGKHTGRRGNQRGRSQSVGMAAPLALRPDRPTEQGGYGRGGDFVERRGQVHRVRVGVVSLPRR
jgi:hypothetical protein